MHLQVTSGGDIPVFFAAGAGCWSDHWRPVLQRLPNIFRGIAYDRHGLGRSAPTRAPRNLDSMSTELNHCFEGLGVDKAILVAHSFSASVVRAFAKMFPNRVTAVLFVDGWHESFGQWEEEHGLGAGTWMDAMMLLLGRAGVFAAANFLSPPPRPDWCETDAQWQWIARASSSGQFFKTMHRETNTYAENDAFLLDAQKRDFPVRCLVCANSLKPEEAPPDYPYAIHNKAWLSYCSRLAEVSSKSQVKVLYELDHMFFLQHPGTVIAELQALVEQASIATH